MTRQGEEEKLFFLIFLVVKIDFSSLKENFSIEKVKSSYSLLKASFFFHPRDNFQRNQILSTTCVDFTDRCIQLRLKKKEYRWGKIARRTFEGFESTCVWVNFDGFTRKSCWWIMDIEYEVTKEFSFKTWREKKQENFSSETN